jgi:hypothetical protein
MHEPDKTPLLRFVPEKTVKTGPDPQPAPGILIESLDIFSRQVIDEGMPLYVE